MYVYYFYLFFAPSLIHWRLHLSFSPNNRIRKFEDVIQQEAWLNVNAHGAYNTLHTHAGAVWSLNSHSILSQFSLKSLSLSLVLSLDRSYLSVFLFYNSFFLSIYLPFYFCLSCQSIFPSTSVFLVNLSCFITFSLSKLFFFPFTSLLSLLCLLFSPYNRLNVKVWSILHTITKSLCLSTIQW